MKKATNFLSFLYYTQLATLFCILLTGCGAKNVTILKEHAKLSYQGTVSCDAETASYGIYRITLETLDGFDAYFACRSDKSRNRYVCSNTKDGTVDEILLVELTNIESTKTRIDAYSWYSTGNYKNWILAIKSGSENENICK